MNSTLLFVKVRTDGGERVTQLVLDLINAGHGLLELRDSHSLGLAQRIATFVEQEQRRFGVRFTKAGQEQHRRLLRDIQQASLELGLSTAHERPSGPCVVRWFHTPCSGFGGSTPKQLLESRGVDRFLGMLHELESGEPG